MFVFVRVFVSACLSLCLSEVLFGVFVCLSLCAFVFLVFVLGVCVPVFVRVFAFFCEVKISLLMFLTI